MSHALQSEQINEIAMALAKAQADMGHAHKDSTNPHFKSSFASLAAVIDAVREPFANQQISFTQAMTKIDGDLVLATTLLHSSGQWLRSFTPILIEKASAQAMGSATSYARRYALSAIAGLSQTDDDGEEASKAPPRGEPAKGPQPAPEWKRSEDPSKYVMTFGKFKGKALDDLDGYEVRNYAEYIVRQAREQNKPIDPKGNVAQFLNAAEAWLLTKGNGKNAESALDYANQEDASWDTATNGAGARGGR